MYKINFYRENNWIEPVKEYIDEINKNNDKLRLTKIAAYMKILGEYGTRAGLPYIKYLKDDIWELRPLRDRIMFCYYKDNTFILLHSFYKKTNKTPKRELEVALKRLKNLKKGDANHE